MNPAVPRPAFGMRVAVPFDHPEPDRAAVAEFLTRCDEQGIGVIASTAHARRLGWQFAPVRRWWGTVRLPVADVWGVRAEADAAIPADAAR